MNLGVNNSTTLIYYPVVQQSCLASVVLVIHAVFPVHATDAAEIQKAPFSGGLAAVTFFIA